MEELKNKLKEKVAKLTEWYGIDSQIIKTIEELAELQHELCRQLLGTKNDSLKSEVAEVWIMMQFIYIHYFEEEEVVELAAIKIERAFNKLKIETNDTF